MLCKFAKQLLAVFGGEEVVEYLGGAWIADKEDKSGF